jgi:hypothetical protein
MNTLDPKPCEDLCREEEQCIAWAIRTSNDAYKGCVNGSPCCFLKNSLKPESNKTDVTYGIKG